MEFKWFVICIVGIMMAGMTAVGSIEYTRNQCKVAYADSGRSADEIVKICGK